MRKVIAGMALLLTLSACGEDGTDTAPTAPASSEPAAVEQPSDPAEKPTRPEPEQTAEGAEAYTDYVIRMLAYTLATPDRESILDEARGECAPCATVAQTGMGLGDEVYAYSGPLTIDIEDAKVTDDTATVRASFRAPSAQILDPQTNVVSGEFPAESSEFDYHLQWVDGSWKVRTWTLPGQAP